MNKYIIVCIYAANVMRLSGNECLTGRILAQRNSNKNPARIAKIWHKKLKMFSCRTELVNPQTSSLVILKMSTPVVSSAKSSDSKVASAPKEVKEKKPRTPTLPAKFGKFIQFGYWFMKRINSLDENVPAVDEDLCIEQLNVFSDIESQQTFVQSFFDDSKDIAKTIRQTIQQKKKDEVKAAKAQAKAQTKAATKEKKPLRQKKEKAPVDDVALTHESDSDKKKPRGRKPKAKVLTSQDAFVNEMVQLANGETDAIPTTIASPAKTPTPKDTKTKAAPKAKAAPKEKDIKVKEVKDDKDKEVKEDKDVKEVKDVKDKEVKETKVKDTKVKDTKVKDKEVKETKVKDVKVKDTKLKDANPPPHDSDQTAVSVLNLNDKQYLIDDNNLVYDFLTHLPIGTFNPNHLTITESK